MKTPSRIALLFAVLGLAVLLLASCGGGDDEEETNGGASSTVTGGSPTGTPLVTIPPLPSPIDPADCPPATGTAPEPDMTKSYASAPEMTIDPSKTYTAVIKTVRGDITLNLLPDVAPNHVNSFVFLAKDGFYDGVKFHRVVPGFVAQAGDPTGTGQGGPGYQLDLEPSNIKYDRGVVGAARTTEPNSAGSQWFITFGNAEHLTGSYTVFAYVTEGMDVADCIAQGDAIQTIQITEE
jgi:peptidylprolyl isomerase